VKEGLQLSATVFGGYHKIGAAEHLAQRIPSP
jgi:hypothetical protein